MEARRWMPASLLLCLALSPACVEGDPMEADPPVPPPPVDPAAVVTRVDVEPPGSHCLTGGAALLGGSDLDGDGGLDDAEVSTTEYVCDGVITGDLIIDDAADAVGLDEVVVVTGSIRADNVASLTALELPALRAIGDQLYVVGCDELTTLAAPALASVAGEGKISLNPYLVDLDLSALSDIRGLELTDNLNLEVLDLGALVRVPLALTLDANPITELDLGALFYAGGLNLSDLEMTSLELPALVSTLKVELTDNAMVDLWAPQLYYVGEDLILRGNQLAQLKLPELTILLGRLVVRDHRALISLALPKLTAIPGPLDVVGNAALTDLALPRLQTIGGNATITGAPALTHLDALAALVQLGGTLEVGGTGLPTLALPALAEVRGLVLGGDATFDPDDNPQLATLELPALRVIWDRLTIKSPSHALPACEVDALLAQLAIAPPLVEVSGTDADAVCP